MEKVQKKMIDLTKDFMSGLYYDREAFLNQEAYELGMEDNKLEIAINMVKDNVNMEDISKYTKLSIAEIKKLKQNMKNI